VLWGFLNEENRMRRMQWGAATLFAVLAVSPAMGQTIDTRSLDSYVYGGGGIFGETFTVGPSQTTLTSYSFWVGANDPTTGNNGTGPYQYYSQLYRWNGTGIVGGALYTSGVLAAPCCDPGGPPRVDFAVGAVPLTDGAQYLALIARTTNGGLDVGYVRVPPGAFGDSYAGGEFIGGTSFGGVAPDPATASYGPIQFAPGNDLMFVAQFAVTAAPEPSSLALLVGGAGALGLLRRRRRR
jgi:hypothetical protein